MKTSEVNDKQKWSAVRDCWLQVTGTDPNFEWGHTNELQQRHGDAIQTCVELGMLSAEVAGYINLCFGQALLHREQLMGLCYIMVPPVSVPRQNLLDQVKALEAVSAVGDIDPETVQKARAALARDIAWLVHFVNEGEVPNELKVDPIAAEAGRVMSQLLTEN